jgi:hypothetical protein
MWEDLLTLYHCCSTLWDEIIQPICQAWRKPQVMSAIKDHLYVFAPRVYPMVLAWTSYGITSAIRELLANLRTKHAQSDTLHPNYLYNANLISVFERVLAYNYTGSARVLLRECLEPMWLTRGIKAYGFPSVNPNIVRFSPSATNADCIEILRLNWPLNDRGEAAMASVRTIELTFGEAYATVRSSHLCSATYWVVTLFSLC